MDNFNNGMNQMNNMNQPPVQAPGYMLWLLLGIIQICTLCCCNLFTPIFGIITVVFAVQANNYFKAGNLMMYQSKIRTAKIINIVGWALMILSFIINLFSGLFKLILSIFE